MKDKPKPDESLQTKMVTYTEEQSKLLLKCLKLIRRGIKFSKTKSKTDSELINDESNKLNVLIYIN